jgi:hypothetical protein
MVVCDSVIVDRISFNCRLFGEVTTTGLASACVWFVCFSCARRCIDRAPYLTRLLGALWLVFNIVMTVLLGSLHQVVR